MLESLPLGPPASAGFRPERTGLFQRSSGLGSRFFRDVDEHARGLTGTGVDSGNYIVA